MNLIIVFYWWLFDKYRYRMYNYYVNVVGLSIGYAVEKGTKELG